jgi:hypothetical protein
MSVKFRFSSTLDLPKTSVSPERELTLSLIFDSDKYVALSIQLETVRPNRPHKILLGTAHNLSEDVSLLKRDNASLKSQINKLHEKVGQSRYPRVGLQGDREIADPSKSATRRNPVRSYATDAVYGSEHTGSPSKQFADRGIALDAASSGPYSAFAVEENSDVFKTVTNWQKTTTGAPAVITVKTSSAASYWSVMGPCFFTNYFKEGKVQGSFRLQI